MTPRQELPGPGLTIIPTAKAVKSPGKVLAKFLKFSENSCAKSSREVGCFYLHFPNPHLCDLPTLISNTCKVDIGTFPSTQPSCQTRFTRVPLASILVCAAPPVLVSCCAGSLTHKSGTTYSCVANYEGTNVEISTYPSR